MSAGLAPTKNEIDTQAGVIARNVQKAMNDVAQFKYFLDGLQDADLTTLGYTGGDIANIRSAYADLAQLATIYQGALNLAAVKDFRTFARRIWGMGDV
jgi:hypothetical protein